MYWNMIATVGNAIIQHKLESEASDEETAALSEQQKELKSILDNMLNAAQSQYDEAVKMWEPWRTQGGNALKALSDALLGGKPLEESPGYKMLLEQSMKQVERKASASGMLNTGSEKKDMFRTASGTYMGYLDRLFRLSEAGERATASTVAAGESMTGRKMTAYDVVGRDIASGKMKYGELKAATTRRHGEIAQNVYEDYMGMSDPNYKKRGTSQSNENQAQSRSSQGDYYGYDSANTYSTGGGGSRSERAQITESDING